MTEVEVYAPIPESLLRHPCSARKSGEDVKSLVDAYLSNRSCVFQYKGVVNSLIKFNETYEERGENSAKNE